MRARVTKALGVMVLLVGRSLAAFAEPSPANTGASATPAASSPVNTGAASPAASATAAAPAASADLSTKPADQQMNGATYAVHLRGLQQGVSELKDQVRRSHTRLAMLSEAILGGGAAGSRAEVHFDNEMSSAFQLIRALFVLDGQVQYNRQDDSGALAEQKDIPVYSGSIPTGDHTIQVALTFQGNGYGVFSYLRGYKFEVKSSQTFTALEGKTVGVTAIAFEKGGVTTPLEQRPKIQWQEKIQALGPGAAGAAVPPSGPADGAPMGAGAPSPGGEK